MIAINKTEKELIASTFPNAHIVRTMKQKSKRHRYYCEETPMVVDFIKKHREVQISKDTTKGGGRHKV